MTRSAYKIVFEKIEMMRKSLQIILPLILLSFLTNDLIGQVKLNLKVSGLKGSNPAYVTAFSEKDKKTERISKGAASLELIRYSQYVVVVYQKGRKPYVVSLDTEKATRQLEANVFLEDGKIIQKDYSPVLHYSNIGGRYSGRSFDLDEVRDKPAFGSQMQEANEDIKRFYTTNQLPTISKERSGFQDDKSMTKTEHNIGQDIYKLLGKKRALELDLERISQNGFKEVYPDSDPATRISACEYNLNILRREKQYYEVSYKLAKSEVEKTEVMVNKQIKKGGAYSEKELKIKRSKLEFAKKEFDVADLNYKNKKTDCWEMNLRADMESTMDPAQKQVLELEINDIRLYQRKQNAKRLYTIHNQMAMDVTERDRLVQLAQAQKFVSDHAKARVALIQNKIKKLEIKDKGTGQLKSKIASAKQDLIKRQEQAFQAEMGYLEHMWNLRTRADLDGQFVDDLYFRQTKLLNLEKAPDRNRTEDFVEGYDSGSSIIEQSDALFNAVVTLSTKKDSRGDVQEVKFNDDFYEIVMDSKGTKTYYKNGKPITALTYRFETIKKYGEYLNNVRVEESKRPKFLDFFKRKTEF